MQINRKDDENLEEKQKNQREEINPFQNIENPFEEKKVIQRDKAASSEKSNQNQQNSLALNASPKEPQEQNQNDPSLSSPFSNIIEEDKHKENLNSLTKNEISKLNIVSQGSSSKNIQEKESSKIISEIPKKDTALRNEDQLNLISNSLMKSDNQNQSSNKENEDKEIKPNLNSEKKIEQEKNRHQLVNKFDKHYEKLALEQNLEKHLNSKDTEIRTLEYLIHEENVYAFHEFKDYLSKTSQIFELTGAKAKAAEAEDFELAIVFRNKVNEIKGSLKSIEFLKSTLKGEQELKIKDFIEFIIDQCSIEDSKQIYSYFESKYLEKYENLIKNLDIDQISIIKKKILDDLM